MEIIKQNIRADIDIVGLPAFRDNRLWCVRQGRSAVVVDPGDAGPVLDFLDRQALQPVAVLLTHHHADHVGGVARLAEAYPQLPVFGPAAESITGVSRPLAGGERLSLLGLEWRVMALAGHTRGHLAYCLDAAAAGDAAGGGCRRLFSGDVLFGLGCGRLFEGSPAEMAASLAAIADLPDDTEIYCGHEYTALNLPFAEAVLRDNDALRRRAIVIRQQVARGESSLPLLLAEEKASNPFLRCTDRVVIDAVRRHLAGRGVDEASISATVGDPVSVFAALREWRNDF